MRHTTLFSSGLLAICLSLTLCATTAAAQESSVPSAEDAQALVNAGNFDKAAAAWKKRFEADSSDGQAAFMYAYSAHMNGDLEAAHDAHLAAAAFPQRRATALYNHACVHALKDEKDLAIRSLHEAIEAGFNNLQQLQTDGDMQNLRGDGRFEAILLDLQPAGTHAGTALTDLAALPSARRFDFYLGEWNMLAQGALESRLEVTRAYDGTGISTVSRDPQGKTSAHAIFLYDEGDDTWRQVWMRRDGMLVVLEGGLADGKMILEMVSENGQPKEGGRSVFQNVTADVFEYLWQESDDGGKTWNTLATRRFERAE